MKKVIVLGLIILSSITNTSAQFSTPTIDGTINSGEYGVHTNGQNQHTIGSTTWYCAWDTTYVYFAISGGFSASGSDAMNVYLDVNPNVPVNGGTGLLSGPTYDQVTPSLPFSTDAFLFVKSGYKDRNVIPTASWSSTSGASSNITDWVNTSSNVIEARVAWSDLGVSSMPSSFNWLGYISYNAGSGGCFGQMPSNNPTGNSPQMIRYYTVTTTSSTGTTKPFAQESYTHLGSSASGFGAISVFDFTMNTSGATITRGSGDWTIANQLLVNNGTVDFGSTSSATAVSGSGINVESNGILKFSSVSNNVDIYGSFVNQGEFHPGASSTSFKASGATIVGNFGDTSGTTNNFGSLIVDVPSSLSTLSNIYINKPNSSAVSLSVTNGEFKISSRTLTLDEGVTVSGSYLDTARISLTTGKVRWHIGSAGSYSLPIGGATKISPFLVVFNYGTFASGAHLDFTLSEVKHPQNASPNDYLNRYWGVENTGISAFDADVKMNYPASDTSGTESNIYSAKYSGGVWELGSANTTSGELQMSSISSFSQFTGGTPAYLPVSLVNFGASQVDNAISISWETTSEQNCSHFNVMKMFDGNKILMATLQGAGNSNSKEIYSTLDYSLSKINTYVLQQVDYNGKIKEYGPIAIMIESEERIGYCFNNRVHVTAIQGAIIKVMDLSGKVLVDETFKGENEELNLSHISREQMVLIELTTPREKKQIKAFLD